MPWPRARRCPDHSRAEEAVLGGPNRANSAITYILVHRADYPTATVRSLVDGLEQLATDHGNGNVRRSAVGQLAAVGRFSDASPEPGLFARLKRIYARTSDPEVRVAVVLTMGQIAERGVAVAFVEQVAKQDPASEEFPNAALWALRALPGMGAEGRAAMKRLHESGAVHHPVGQAELAEMAKRDYRLEPKR